MIYSAAIDSNLLTYLIEALKPGYDPKDDKSNIAPHRLAILRIYFYSKQPLYITPTVQHEYSEIRMKEWKKEHESAHNILLLDLNPLPDSKLVSFETAYYSRFHKEKLDCKIVAEAEVAGIDYFLTSDEKLYKNLRCHSKSLKIMKADEFWVEVLTIPKGTDPRLAPHPKNPLYEKSWWKW